MSSVRNPIGTSSLQSVRSLLSGTAIGRDPHVVPRYCEGEILISGCGNSALSEKMYVVCFK